MQLKQELHNLQKNKMNINDYFIKVKNLADVFASIKALVKDEDLVVVTLNGLGKDCCGFGEQNNRQNYIVILDIHVYLFLSHPLLKLKKRLKGVQLVVEN